MTKKTRPIGKGVRNITVTLATHEVLDLERQARISGVDRSPYIRTLVQWASAHGVVVRPEAKSYLSYLSAIHESVSPLPKIQYEIVLTKLGAPLNVVLDPERPKEPLGIVYLDDYTQASARVAEDPSSATAKLTRTGPNFRRAAS